MYMSHVNVLVEASEQNFALAFCCGQNPKSGMATRENSRRSRTAHESTAESARRCKSKQNSDSNTASTFVVLLRSKFWAFVKQAVMRAAKFNAGSAAEFWERFEALFERAKQSRFLLCKIEWCNQPANSEESLEQNLSQQEFQSWSSKIMFEFCN